MSDNIVRLPGSEHYELEAGPRSKDIEPLAVIEGALEKAADLQSIIFIGTDSEGRLYAASSQNHLADNILLLERAKRRLLETLGDDRFS